MSENCSRVLAERGTLAQNLVRLTDENWAEEERDGDVDDRGGHVQKPVGAHGEESQEEQKEEQGVLVLLNLTAKSNTVTFREWKQTKIIL